MKKNHELLRLLTGCRKKLTIMRNALLILMLSTFQVLALGTYSQTTKLNLELSGVTIRQVLSEIEDNSEFYFLYNSELVDVTKVVDVSATEQNIDVVLTQMFNTDEVDFLYKDRHIIITPRELSDEIQQKLVSGTITDNFGVALPGVTVVVKGTTNGTITNVDGKYSIVDIPENATLVFSFVGMRTQEIIVADKTIIDVVMMEDAIGLDEVVAVGYGIQKRSHITGSIASVDAEKLNRAPATNTTAMLTGRLPGLYVKNSSGQPGRDEASFNIRGFGNALVIVDGVPRDFQQLDPNEIESVSILKDASAAVYGARAGNGVVLVTTKKGSRGAKPKINYTGNMSIQQPTFMHDMADAVGYAKYYRQAEDLVGVAYDDLKFNDEAIEKYRAGTEPGYAGADWQDIVFREWAPQQQHNINVTGGTDKVNYFLSTGFLDQESMLRSGAGTYNRYNISSNVDVNLTEDLKVGLNVKWREEYRDDPTAFDKGRNEYYQLFRMIATAAPTVQLIPGETDIIPQTASLDMNPLILSRQDLSGFSRDRRKQFDVILSMDYNLPVKGLSVNGKFYRKYYDRENTNTIKPWDVYNHDYATGENILAASNKRNEIEVTNWKYGQITSQVALNYDRQFGDHALSGTALAEYFYSDRYEMGARRTDLISHDIPYLYSGNGTQTNYDLPDENGRKSFVGRLNYNYKEKYLAEFLFRADASIQFPKDSRWGFFPGVSLGWRVSEEDFLKDSESLDYMKLRASYANLGYDAISNFDYLTGYELQNNNGDKYGFGDQMMQSTLRSIGLPNSLITWEEMTTYNVGADVVFWNGLLGAEADVFYRKRTGLLQDRMASIPSTFGAQLPKENLGIRDNRGFELVLKHQNKVGEVEYSISGNVTWTREKFVYEEEREFDMEDADDARLNQKTGNWVNRMFGYETDGFYDTQEEIDNDGLEYTDFGEAAIGDIKYVDQNGDDIINYRDKVLLGRGNNPEIFLGLNADLKWRNFDFSMLWQGAANYNVMFNGLVVAPNLSIGFIPYQYHVDNAWNSENPEAAALPAPNLGGLNTHNDQPADIYLRDGKYLRLKTLNFGYTLPESITQNVGINRVRVYFSGYNLLTLMPNDIFDFDPESEAGGSLSTYPVQRVLTFGINVTL